MKMEGYRTVFGKVDLVAGGSRKTVRDPPIQKPMWLLAILFGGGKGDINVVAKQNSKSHH